MQFDIILYNVSPHDSADSFSPCAAALQQAAKGYATLTIAACGTASTPPPGLASIPWRHGKTPARARAKALLSGGAAWVLLWNSTCRPETNFFPALLAAIAAHPQAGAFMCRVLPGDAEQHIDPVTLAAPYVDGPVLALRRAAFIQAGGYDVRLPFPAADVDLSWRLLALDCPLYYVPFAVASNLHPSPNSLANYAHQTLGALLLAYKYGRFAQRLAAERQYWRTFKNPSHFPGVRRVLLRQYGAHLLTLWPLLFWRLGHRRFRRAAPCAPGGEFASRRGPCTLRTPFTSGPFISVVVRTHRRPHVLRNALQSLAHQTYRNFEVVVVEDGPDTAREMLEQEFAHLPLRYHATGIAVGRGTAGNLGLSLAQGEYLNFLDDDDAFYPDHLELMAQKAAEHPDADLVIGCAMAQFVADDGHTTQLYPVRFDRIDLFMLCQSCRFSIQSVLFKKSLYKTCGGLAEAMGGHEDWAMWLRFFRVAQRIHPKKIDVERCTSVFTQPANPKTQQARLAEYEQFDLLLFNNPDLRFEVSMADMRAFYDGMIDDLRHLHRTKCVEEYLNQQAHRGGLD